MKQSVTFTIDDDGDVTFEIDGIKGKGCKVVADGYVKALGKEKARRFTREVHERPALINTTATAGRK